MFYQSVYLVLYFVLFLILGETPVFENMAGPIVFLILFLVTNWKEIFKLHKGSQIHESL